MGHTSFQLNRRAFLKAGLSTAGTLALGPAFLERALAAGPVTVGEGPYGPLGPYDVNGIALPESFTSREVARGGSPVAGSSPAYQWHLATDGQATFPTLSGGKPDGGWILVANSEIKTPGGGGVSAVEFGRDGEVERAYQVLAGTNANCSGGPTPWGAWLSCEEHSAGVVHECDPTKLNMGVARPALGVFKHEAACVDPARERIYLTEDEPDGCLYRFTPEDYPDLGSGLLEVAVGEAPGPAAPGTLTWVEVPNPAGGPSEPTRHQIPAAARFERGEGLWHDEGVVYLTTSGDNRVWSYAIAESKLVLLYDRDTVGPGAPLGGVDAITVAPSGDVYICEDGADNEVCMVTPEFEVTRFLRLDPDVHAGPPQGTTYAGNETVGVVFSPDGNRMYFGAQRSFPQPPGRPAGVVYEVNGPFRRPAAPGSGPLPPGLRLRGPRRRSAIKMLKRGLTVKLELDEPSSVRATLRASVRGGDGRSRSRLLAEARTSVAVSGSVALRLKTTKGGRALLRSRRGETVAKLAVTATDDLGRSSTRHGTVRLDPAPRAPGARPG